MRARKRINPNKFAISEEVTYLKNTKIYFAIKCDGAWLGTVQGARACATRTRAVTPESRVHVEVLIAATPLDVRACASNRACTFLYTHFR